MSAPPPGLPSSSRRAPSARWSCEGVFSEPWANEPWEEGDWVREVLGEVGEGGEAGGAEGAAVEAGDAPPRRLLPVPELGQLGMVPDPMLVLLQLLGQSNGIGKVEGGRSGEAKMPEPAKWGSPCGKARRARAAATDCLATPCGQSDSDFIRIQAVAPRIWANSNT